MQVLKVGKAMKIAAVVLCCSVVQTAFIAPQSRAESTTAVSLGEAVKLAAPERRQIHDFLVDNGAPESTASKIIRNLEKGELPDSDNGSNPISIERKLDHGDIVERRIFEDGSLSITRIPDLKANNASGQVNMMAVGGCKKSSSHYAWSYTDCLASGVSAIVSIRFRFNYGGDVGHRSASITKYWGQTYQTRAATISNAHFERLPASHVRFGGTLNSSTGLFSGSRFLDLSVNGFNATANLTD
ncbi:hypothetical protein [Acidipropionibacterium timonense]|uniref:hypothetical protein n=1 Tax=Acidipropionibacterium timonense TaxID=2161818 RepID=UPI0010302AF7|nr:hypothetical protein [Acidipropionibacterium timonense]